MIVNKNPASFIKIVGETQLELQNTYTHGKIINVLSPKSFENCT